MHPNNALFMPNDPNLHTLHNRTPPISDPHIKKIKNVILKAYPPSPATPSQKSPP